MTPLFFDGCFGWLHDAVAGRRGVVLCNALGHEELWAHKGFHQLAGRFARAGMPALRFDYPGTGDAADLHPNEPRIDAWLAGIRAAVGELRRRTGVQDVVLCGLRLGGALAAIAARDVGASAVILLAPVASGKNYLREMRMLQQTWLERAGEEVRSDQDPGDEHFDMLGHRLPRHATQEIMALDLRLLPQRSAEHMLICTTGARDVDTLSKHVQTLGATVDVLPFDDYAEFMQEPIFSVVPDQTWDAVVNWAALRPGMPAADVMHRPAHRSGETVLELDRATERPVVFRDGLFGVLCEPKSVKPRLPAVLFANMGATHHVGAGRFAVEFARRLARAGIASLRLDVNGLGDSAQAGQRGGATPIYAPQPIDDVCSAADWLAARGYARSVVFGVSSGSYLGLHAAVENDHIVGLLLVNLQRFLWHPGTRLPRWQMLGLKEGDAAVTPAQADEVIEPAQAAAADREAVRAMLRALDLKGVRTRLIYGPGDPGLLELEKYFGPGGAELVDFPTVLPVIVERLDHGLLSTPARGRVMGFCERFIQDCSSAGPSWPARTRSGRPALPHRGATRPDGHNGGGKWLHVGRAAD